MSATFRICATALLLSACTQKPAQIVLMGEQEFARNSAASAGSLSALAPAAGGSSGNTYSAPIAASAPSAPVDNRTVSTVQTGAVTASDLPPPAMSAAETNKSVTGSVVELKPAAPPPPAPVKMHKVSSSGFIWPVENGKVISSFGPKGIGKVNDGVNIAAESGEPVYASAEGEVVFVGDQLKGYGNMVLLKHSGNRHTTYAHLARSSVTRYDRVKQGDIIGYVGASGNVAQPQVFFALREAGKAVDPQRYLSSDYASLAN